MEPSVAYNCVIEPPEYPELPMPTADASTSTEPPPPTPIKKECCPEKKKIKKEVVDLTGDDYIPPCPFVYRGDPLAEALPTILVGVGIAYLIGLATGSFIFSTAE